MKEWMPAKKLKQPELLEVTSRKAPSLVEVESSVAHTSEGAIFERPVGHRYMATNILDCPIPPNDAVSKIDPACARNSLLSFPEPPPDLGARYDILAFVGSGGMGSVWKVYDKTLGETFAIKVLNSDLIADATAVKRFEKEANLASDLTHTNIAAIFGPGADSAGRPYIIMKYVDGESLADIMAREGKLSEKRAVDIFTQICEALQHSHMKGIIHRDIKPSNIIISKTESGGDMVHVVDFGIARSIHEEVTKTQALTKAVDVFGSPRYMSPEQLLGKEVTAQSDIYSLGCVFYEMLTGAPPFTDENPVRLILQHISESPDFSKLPAKWNTVIHFCLAKQFENRASTIGVVLALLSNTQAGYVKGLQGINFVHCSMTVAVVLLFNMDFYTYGVVRSSHALEPTWWLILLWQYVGMVNAESAARTHSSRVLEFNLLLCAMITAAMAILSMLNLNFIGTILMPIFTLGACWLMLQRKAIDGYSSIINKLRSRLVPILDAERASGTTLKLFSFVIRFTGMATLFCLTAVTTSVFYCSYDLGFTVGSSISRVLSSLLIAAFMLLLLLICASISDGRTFREALKSSIRILSTTAAISVVSTTLLLTKVGADGFNQYVRHGLLPLNASKEVARRVSLEAMQYPDSYFANQARLSAVENLISERNYEQAATLCDQVINSKSDDDSVHHALAQFRNAKAESYQNHTEISLDKVRRALSYLENAKQVTSKNWEATWLDKNRDSQIVEAATEIGISRVINKDLENSMHALSIAEKHLKNASESAAWWTADLERRITELQAELKDVTSKPSRSKPKVSL
jgi:serine/threonine protein kinase